MTNEPTVTLRRRPCIDCQRMKPEKSFVPRSHTCIVCDLTQAARIADQSKRAVMYEAFDRLKVRALIDEAKRRRMSLWAVPARPKTH